MKHAKHTHILWMLEELENTSYDIMMLLERFTLEDFLNCTAELASLKRQLK